MRGHAFLIVQSQDQGDWVEGETRCRRLRGKSGFPPDSVTRLGDCWKFLVTWFLSKVAQMHGKFMV